MAAAAAAALSLLNRRLRIFRKRRTRISQFEDRLALGESLNDDQLEILRSKPVVLAVIDEFENLRASFVEEDISGGSPAITQVPESESPVPSVDSPKEIEVLQKTPDESQHPKLAPDQHMTDECTQRVSEQAVDEPPVSDEQCLVDSSVDIASVEQEQNKSRGDLEEEQQQPDTEEEGQWMPVQRKAFQNLKVRDPYMFGDYRGYRRNVRGGRGQAGGPVYQQGRRGGVYLNGQGQGVGHVQQGGRGGVYLNSRGQGVGPMQQGGHGGIYLNGGGQGVGPVHQQGGRGGGYSNGGGQGVGPVHQQGGRGGGYSNGGGQGVGPLHQQGGRGGVYENGRGQGGMTIYENNRGRAGMNGRRGEGVACENVRGRGGMVVGRAGGMVYENGRGRGGMNGYMIGRGGRGGRDHQNEQGQYSRGQEGGRPHNNNDAAQIGPVEANGQQV